MTFTLLPSMRIIYFSNQSSEVVNAVIEGLEALGNLRQFHQRAIDAGECGATRQFHRPF